MIAALALVAALSGDIDQLAWMAGAWREEKNGRVVREVWHAPLGGMMSGVSQTNPPGRKPQVEFSTITVEPAGLTFTAYLDGQGPTAFVATTIRDGEVVFENKAHDFPQRVIYRRCGVQLCPRIEGTVDGKAHMVSWTYSRER